MTNNQELLAFAKRVKTMRNFQKQFFLARKANLPESGDFLQKSKNMEKEIDAEVERLTNNQNNLF
jgi:hypothetical protein